ncbi:MAG: DUF4160 domain-containing protein [Chloroflexi bacterium]|nr:MAG: DUF4160 domain-containing protein [Chloroflexota bacterium]
MSPTIDIVGPYRIFFYSGDRSEPPHVHVEREGKTAKFWLKPVRLQDSGGFRAYEIKRIQHLVEERQEAFLERWYEYFSD